MKKATFIILLGLAVAAVASVNSITWKSTTIDLGQVKAGETAKLNFDFTNNGNETVTILEAKGSCGCTNVSYPKYEIEPGASASISAEFTSHKAGLFKKNIKIKTSASEDYTYLNFQGEVVE